LLLFLALLFALMLALLAPLLRVFAAVLAIGILIAVTANRRSNITTVSTFELIGEGIRGNFTPAFVVSLFTPVPVVNTALVGGLI
jgi:hypothetical protein